MTIPVNDLVITDGTTTGEINLFDSSPGYWLREWNPQVADYKQGGIFQDTSLAPGRRLVDKKFGNVTETFTLSLNRGSQDDLIRYLQDLLRLLEKASDYWTTDWQNTPVYLQAKSACETNTRYALVHRARIAELDDPYAQPFFGGGYPFPAMEDLTLVVERGHWLSNAPGNSTCVQTSATYEWNYNQKWSVIDVDTGSAANNTNGLFKASNNYLYTTSGSTGLFRSVDDGDNWTSEAVVGNNGSAFCEAPNGDLFYIDRSGNCYRSVDDGDNWTNPGSTGITDSIAALYPTANNLLVGVNGAILQSTDNGANFSTLFSTGENAYIAGLLESTTGRLIATAGSTAQTVFGPYSIWISDNGGATWTKVYGGGLQDNASKIVQLGNGTIVTLIQIGTSVYPLLSSDDGDTWNIQPSIFTGTMGDGFITEGSNSSTVYVFAENNSTPNNVLFISTDSGITWTQEGIGTLTFDQDTTGGMVEADDGTILVSGRTGPTANEQMLVREPASPITLGQVATCNDQVFVPNGMPIANITNLFYEDNSGGPSYTTITFPETSFPSQLFPNPAGQNDALYLIINSSVVNSGPFCGVVFDIGQIFNISAGADLAITWEYYNGAWTTLNVKDGTVNFSVTGVQSVHWRNPTDWTTVTVNSITGFMVRARISTASTGSQSPTQQNRDIYIPTLPRADIVATQVLGDIPAIAQIKCHVQSDRDGRGGNNPDLYANRIIVGLRTYSRGNNFQAYLNCSDEQNPIGVTVSVGANSAFATDNSSPTGRVVQYDPAGADATLTTQVTFSLGPSIARDYYGRFHAFVRVRRVAGSISDINVALQIVTGSGGVQFTSKSKQVQTTTGFELLDFGQVDIPASSLLLSTELTDSTEIRIQMSSSGGLYTPDLVLYDLVLIPVDEWSIDSFDGQNDSNSIVGNDDAVDKLLDIDSINNPKSKIRSLVRIVGSELISAIYTPISNGEAILQSNVQQRLWFLAAQTYTTTDDDIWIAPAEICSSIQVFKNERYLGLRGDR